MPHALTHRVSILCLLLFATSTQAVTTIQNQNNQNANSSGGTNWVPTGKGFGVQVAPGSAPPLVFVPNAAAASNGIDYHGGPVMTGTTNVYYIWYGKWTGNTAQGILTDLASNIGGSPYYNINTTYYNSAGVSVANVVAFAGATSDNYSQGVNLTDTSVQTVVTNAINSGRLPRDANGVYFVLSSADVNETSGFCTQYCGFHTHLTAQVDIKYAFVGNPDRCPTACETQTSASPNGNPGADGMANVIAHELEETTTDPDLNAWWDSSNGWENADKCAWNFGSTYTVANGSKANMKLGARNFMIQQNWVNANGGYCALSYISSPPPPPPPPPPLTGPKKAAVMNILKTLLLDDDN